jgi:PEP-CTERM motif
MFVLAGQQWYGISFGRGWPTMPSPVPCVPIDPLDHLASRCCDVSISLGHTGKEGIMNLAVPFRLRFLGELVGQVAFVCSAFLATSVSHAGYLQEEEVTGSDGEKRKLAYYVYNLDSPGIKTAENRASLDAKRTAENSPKKNNDNEPFKASNLWGNYAFYQVFFEESKPIDMRFAVLNSDENNLDANMLGTEKTSEYWIPIDVFNFTPNDWKGLRLKIGFGTFVKNGDTLKDEFKQIADIDNLDFDFNKKAKDDATQVPDPDAAVFGPHGSHGWAFDKKPDTYSWDDTEKNYIKRASDIPPQSTKHITYVKFSFDTPNNSLIPRDYWMGADAYNFTIRIEPVVATAVPEPSSIAMMAAGLVAILVCKKAAENKGWALPRRDGT